MSSSSECRAASRWLREESSDLLAHRLGALPQAFGTGHPRLQTKLHECLCAALPGVQSAPALVIAVMGASMAAGAMNCNARVICNGTNLAPHLAWPRKLQERLSAAVPRCRVEVSVLGYGGTTSETSAYTLGEVLKRHKSGQKPLDAVLLDTSTNDFVVSQWGQNKERRQYLLAAIESMVRRLEYAGVTAVLVDTLTGPSFECPTKSPNKDATRITRRAPLVGDSLYAPLAAHWGVPFVSLLSSSCAADPRDDKLHWRAGCGALDMVGWECVVHPGPSAHAALARVLSHAIATLAVGVPSPRGSPHASAHDGAVGVPSPRGSRKGSTRTPSTMLTPARALPKTTLQPEFEVRPTRRGRAAVLCEHAGLPVEWIRSPLPYMDAPPCGMDPVALAQVASFEICMQVLTMTPPPHRWRALRSAWGATSGPTFTLRAVISRGWAATGQCAPTRSSRLARPRAVARRGGRTRTGPASPDGSPTAPCWALRRARVHPFAFECAAPLRGARCSLNTFGAMTSGWAVCAPGSASTGRRRGT